MSQNKLVEKFNAWREIPIEVCRCPYHYVGEKPVADALVCSRERAWREYVRERDLQEKQKDLPSGVELH